MSLAAKRTYVVPVLIVQVARAVFPKGNPVMSLYDDLHMVVEDCEFADLFPARGRPAEAPVRLALATLLQFMKGVIFITIGMLMHLGLVGAFGSMAFTIVAVV